MSTNTIDRLIAMANQIGLFFGTMPDRQQALLDLATHLKRFWEPRMLRALWTHVEVHGGAGLDGVVLQALRAHRDLFGAQALS